MVRLTEGDVATVDLRLVQLSVGGLQGFCVDGEDLLGLLSIKGVGRQRKIRCGRVIPDLRFILVLGSVRDGRLRGGIRDGGGRFVL